MGKGRTGRNLLLLLLFLVAVFVVLRLRSAGFFSLGAAEAPGLPLDLERAIPREWTLQEGSPPQCDLDGDGELEWLVRYRYNQTEVAQASSAATSVLRVGPWGAAVFDMQADTLTEDGQSPDRYRSTKLVPYKLLPDFYPGKGQGYLGESSIETFLVPNVPPGADCRASEINVLGYGQNGLPTRISIFQWTSRISGYQGAHLAGSGRILTEPRADSGQPITRIVTYDRIENHRSLLCQAETYERFALTVSPLAAERTVDFCFGAPREPFYPEGVVVAALRGLEPVATEPNAPPLDSYLFDNVEAPAALNLREVDRKPVPILRVRSPSSVETTSSDGATCTPSQIRELSKLADPTASLWWCGRERASVVTQILLDGAVRVAEFTMASIVPTSVNSDIHWRIEGIKLEEP